MNAAHEVARPPQQRLVNADSTDENSIDNLLNLISSPQERPAAQPLKTTSGISVPFSPKLPQGNIFGHSTDTAAVESNKGGFWDHRGLPQNISQYPDISIHSARRDNVQQGHAKQQAQEASSCSSSPFDSPSSHGSAKHHPFNQQQQQPQYSAFPSAFPSAQAAALGSDRRAGQGDRGGGGWPAESNSTTMNSSSSDTGVVLPRTTLFAAKESGFGLGASGVGGSGNIEKTNNSFLPSSITTTTITGNVSSSGMGAAGGSKQR